MRGIYKITNTKDGKCYIGKSEDLAERLKNHIQSLTHNNNRNKHMQSAYNESGVGSFSIEILEELDEDDDINERERYYIELYKSYDRNYGYNLTHGGDGGNSYVDCMTEEEKEEHYKKHREIRMGDGNCIYGKHLYTDGVVQKYISDDEIEEYEAMGWHHGANDSFKEKCRKRSIGNKNPFYGKHHSKETLEKIKRTKEERKVSNNGYLMYHKGNELRYIKPEEISKYESDGWVHGNTEENIEKIKEAKNKNKDIAQ